MHLQATASLSRSELLQIEVSISLLVAAATVPQTRGTSAAIETSSLSASISVPPSSLRHTPGCFKPTSAISGTAIRSVISAISTIPSSAVPSGVLEEHPPVPMLIELRRSLYKLLHRMMPGMILHEFEEESIQCDSCCRPSFTGFLDW